MIVSIKDKNMPENCQECFCLNDEYFYCQAMSRKPSDENVIERRPDWCPLIEIPPHGDLIDRDALKDVQQADADFFKGSSDYGEKCRYDEAINAVANIINAPTIIPAEEGET